MSALQIQNLTVHLSNHEVLRHLSLRVAPGEVCCIIGPNGSGKSTLLRAVCGLVAPSAGAVLWQDAPLPREPLARARLVSLLPQMFAGGDEMTVEELAMLGRTPHLNAFGVPSQNDKEIVETVLVQVAPDLLGRLVGQLSGGQRQRVALCRALTTQAPVLLLDEPISALDLRYQYEILGLVSRLTREKQLATICVLHGINLAAQIADSMLLLNEFGQLVSQGSPHEVMTEDHLEMVYGVPLRIAPHPITGKPQAQSLWAG